MQIRKIILASKYPIMAVLLITLVWESVRLAAAGFLMPGQSVQSLAAIMGTLVVLTAAGGLLGIASVAATFWAGFNGIRKHGFDYGDALVAGAAIGVLNGGLSIAATAASLLFGVQTAPQLGAGMPGVASFVLLAAALESVAMALGGAIAAMALSFAGAAAGKILK